MIMASISLRARPIVAFSLTFALACATPPDVQPFADATHSLSLAVGATSSFAQAGIAEVDAGVALDFQREWEHRIKAIDAMSEYADSLVAVVEAGGQGASAAQRVIDSAERFFGTLKVAYPLGSDVGSVLATGAVKAFELYAKDRAADTVAEAVDQADPAVQEVAEILSADFITMGSILQTLRQTELSEFITQSKVDNPLIAQVQTLEAEFQERNKRLMDGMTDPDLLKKVRDLLEVIERERAVPAYAEYKARLKAIEERYDGYEQVVNQAAALVRAWGQSHSKLAQAAKLGRPPTFQVLVEMSREMLEVFEEVRKQR